MVGSQDFIADPRNNNLLIYLNGELVERADAKVSIFDGGFVVGDGVWEGLRLHNGKLLFVDEHLNRLYWGAEKIALDIGLNKSELIQALYQTVSANNMHTGVHIRLMVTRGEKTGLNQDPRNAIGKATIAIVAEYKQPNLNLHTQGLKLATSNIRCTPTQMFDMRLNSHSRLNLMSALLDAIKDGADEALMLDPNDKISSCNATNFFMVKNGEVITSRGEYCFHGVTRANVLKLCQQNNIQLSLRDFTLQEVYEADEAFVTGTFGGITPVSQIDQFVLPVTLPGPTTQMINQLYQQLKDEYANGE